MTRPPIIAVLGHVDHGKTSLLDQLRKTSIAADEPGGITQTIGAFKIGVRSQESTPKGGQAGVRSLTFIDTPGHEAFSKMRSLGANVADIALLMVAADDGVKPQTLESVSIIKSAGIPFIVCINKIDLADANPENVKIELGKHGCAVEGFGGAVPVVEISAKTDKNLPELLEMISLVWQLHLSNLSDLRNLSNLSQLEAPIIDSRLDPHSGPIANVIIRQGTLRLGDQIAADVIGGKVKALTDDRGQRVKQALPGDPVQVLGLKSVPPVGSVLTHLLKATGNRQQATGNTAPYSLLHTPDSKPVILKADSVATLETLENVVFSIPEPKYAIISSAVGDITESDILLAASSKANIIGFRINTSKKRQELAQNEAVLTITDNIIYRLLEKLTDLQKPKKPEFPPETGRGKIVKVFTINETEIAGCIVESGKIGVGDSAFLTKDSLRVGPARIKQLKFRSDNIKEARVGTECGVLLVSETEGQKLKLSEGQDIIAYQTS